MLGQHKIKERLIYKFKNESELIKTIQSLQDIFTQKRNKIGDYVLSRPHVAAYAQYYTPTNAPKINFLLDQIDAESREALKKLTFIDYGCGPGTYLYPVAERKMFKHYTAIDQAPMMLDQARSLLRDFNNINFLHDTSSLPLEPYHLNFGNSLNEIGFEKALQLVDELAPESISLIEPGTKETFSHVLNFREGLINRGHNIQYPCASTKNCPLDDDNWCHQVLKLTHDKELERLCQLAKQDRRSMPMIAHFYNKSAQKSENYYLLRIIRELKYAFEIEICYSFNNSLVVEKRELLKKGLSKKYQKEFKKNSFGVKLDLNLLEKGKAILNGKT